MVRKRSAEKVQVDLETAKESFQSHFLKFLKQNQDFRKVFLPSPFFRCIFLVGRLHILSETKLSFLTEQRLKYSCCKAVA